MPTKKKKAGEKPAENFEDAIQELEELTERLAHEPDSLSNLITDYERGQKLINFCQGELSTARKRIELIQAANNAQSEAENASPTSESSDDNDNVRLF